MRRFRLFAIVLSSLAAAAALTAGGGAAGATGATGTASATASAASDKLPVPYDFLISAVVAGPNPLADPPGANDWSCKPTAKHPEPVILTHGLLGNKDTNWQTYAPLLHNNGYCVFALTYGQSRQLPSPLNQYFGGLTQMEDSAVQLKAFVAKVLDATGASKVDIVGHSEGTVMPDYYAKFLGGARYIDKYISLAPLWHGTTMGGLSKLVELGGPLSDAVINGVIAPYFGSGPEFLAGSDFYAKLREGGTPAVPGIHYTNIVTKYDELVQPYTSGIQDGMRNLTVQDYCKTDFTEHFEIAADPVAAALVLNALDPAHPHTVPCRLVLPFIGG
jgi:triacylglycerol esterase/lipase EstA (alpha/beta hydrolase family)